MVHVKGFGIWFCILLPKEKLFDPRIECFERRKVHIYIELAFNIDLWTFVCQKYIYIYIVHYLELKRRFSEYAFLNTNQKIKHYLIAAFSNERGHVR